LAAAASRVSTVKLSINRSSSPVSVVIATVARTTLV